MGDPLTALSTLTGTGLDLVGGIEESNARIDESRSNAKLADAAAADAIARGTREAGKQRLEGGQLIARQRVAYANSGVDATVGTPATVMENTRATTELDAQTLQNNAAREAWGFKAKAAEFRKEAGLERRRSDRQAIGTILGGAGRLASKYGG